MRLFFFILFIAYVIGFIILDSSSDLVEGMDIIDKFDKMGVFTCGPGKIHDGRTSCKVCTGNTYNDENNDLDHWGSCKKCPDGFKANKSKTQCICDKKGWVPNKDGKCVCPADHFYENNKCFECGNNITGSKTINRSQGGDSSQDCVCPIGTYYLEKDNLIPKCIECKPGTYNDSQGLETNCSICPAGKYSEAGSSSCSDCPDGHISSEGSGDCKMCEAGTGPNSDKTACVECGIGRFSNPTKTGGVCKTFDEAQCPDNQKFGGSARGLEDCPPVCEKTVTYVDMIRGTNGAETWLGQNYEKQTKRFVFRDNMPFVDRPTDYEQDPQTGDTSFIGAGGECDKAEDCIPGGEGYTCKNVIDSHTKNTCEREPTIPYDEIQEKYYEKDRTGFSWFTDGKPNNTTCSNLTPVNLPFRPDLGIKKS